jgi:phosphatidate cytidylyltransferase
LKRILGALLFAPAVLALIYFGTPLIFFLAVSSAVIICLVEFYRMVEASGGAPLKFIGFGVGFLIVLGFFYERLPLVVFAISGGTMALFIRTLLVRDELQNALEVVAYTLVGLFFVAWLLAHLVLLRGMEAGRFYILFLFLVIWAGDTAAYYVGKAVGRHKLAPRISPGKTIEGAVAGLGGSLAMAFLARWWFLSGFSVMDALLLGVLLSVMGQLGDLSESLVKRRAEVKDSGKIILGHGGLLDRLDSLIFSAPLLYYYIITVK